MLVQMVNKFFYFSVYAKIWPLFGAANQLLAALGLLVVCAWLGSIGKNNLPHGRLAQGSVEQHLPGQAVVSGADPAPSELLTDVLA